MYLYGASGHAKVIADILTACGEPVEGIFDDDPARVSLGGYPVGTPQHLAGPLIVSIGNNRIRKKISESVPVAFGTAVHPSAVVSGSARIGAGTVVMQGAVLQADVRVGRHCIVNTGASIDHECEIGDFVHISPHATLCGNVTVGAGSWIGAGSVVIPGVKIGRWSVIGAGSVVTKNIPDGVLAVGNRCKIIKNLNE